MRCSIVSLIRQLRSKNNILLIVAAFFSLQSFGQSGDSLRIGYNYINSFPQNAPVYINDEPVGMTPLFFVWPDSIFPKQLKLSKNGYVEYSESINSPGTISKNVNLIPKQGKGFPDPVREDRDPYFKSQRKIVPIVISSLATIGAGISAFYFKSLAIENRDLYDNTGDKAAYDRKKKYDLYGGVSLILFQAGLGALLYYLLID
ncbi:hypothetical protein MTYM_00190 [Methylococcales bacterium]|nr:hypothetical protein MTYM_00190 [Methylococcales bacterium]